MNISKALTWNDLAEIYDKSSPGRCARTLPMNRIFDWAAQQKSKFWVNPEEGTIHERRSK